MIFLAAEVFSGLFPKGLFEFWAPGIVIAFLVMYLIYMFAKEFGFIDW